MSLPWFRMYAEWASDPVVQSLAFEDQRHHAVLLCLKCNGTLDRNIAPEQRERIIMRGLGLDPVAASEAKRRLIEVGLIGDDWQPNGWDKRQFVADISTGRVRKHRMLKDSRNVSETIQETIGNSSGNGPDTEQTQNRTDIETAQFMFGLIQSLNPKHREPNIKRWANDIRLMRERDGRTDDEIRSLFAWANKHQFWRTNILSPATLRVQWDKLTIQRNNGGQNATRERADNSAVGRVRAANGIHRR